MKKYLLTFFMSILAVGLYAQTDIPIYKNELKIGMEMPVVGKSHAYTTQSNISQGFSIRYLRSLWKGLSIGVVGGGHFYNQICEMGDGDFSFYSYSFNNYYVHAMLHYKVVNNAHFAFALDGSAGLGYVNNKEKHVVYSCSPNPGVNGWDLTEVGKHFHYLFGAETTYRFTNHLSINLEYKYDIKYVNHILGIGFAYSY